MNKAYKVVFNETTGTYVAVAEIVSARGKASSTQENTTTITTVPQSVTGRFMGKVIMALLGLTTALAMPLAHASWINAANGGGANPSNSYGTASSTGIALGSDTTAATRATASGTNSIAVGSGAVASSRESIVLGKGASVTNLPTRDDEYNRGSIAIGSGATANSGSNGFYNGDLAYSAIAIGAGSKASGLSAIALGQYTTAGNPTALDAGQAIALGSFANAYGDQSTALGNNVKSSGNSSVAIGGDDINKVITSSGAAYKALTGS